MKRWTRLAAMVLGASLAGTALAQDKPAEAEKDKIRATVVIEKARLEEAEHAADQAKAEAQAAQRAVLRWRAAGDPADVMFERPVPEIMTLVAPLEMEKAAFLGVTTSPVTPALREQLKLQRGVGLVVDHVEPESPAAKAGLKRYDILQKLNDQLLINSHQLQVLVRTYKPGDKIDLSVIREGKPVALAAALIEKEVPVVNDASPWGTTPDVMHFGPGAAVAGVPAVRATRVPFPGGAGGMTIMKATGAERTAIFAEGDTRLMFTVKDKSVTLTATDKDGKEMFKGPIDTEEQRKALPKPLAEKLENPAVKKLIESLKSDKVGMFHIDLDVDAPPKK